MSLQDLVAAECAQPNPLARFVNNFADEKFGGLSQDQWVQRDGVEARRDRQSGVFRDEEEFSDEEEFERKADGYFKGIDGARGFDLREYQEDLRRDMPPLPDIQPPADHALGAVFKNFIAGAHSKNMLGRFEDLPDLGLSERDKAKIRDRAGIMSRHFYANHSQDFAEEQMEFLLHSLHIGGDRHRELERFPSDFEDSWQRARTTTSTRTGAEWEREYERDRAGQIHNEIDDYEDIIRNTEENRAWLEENSHYGAPEKWVSEYERGEGAQWVHEYANKSDRQIEEETMEAAWNEAAHDRLMEAAWSERERQTKGGGNLTEITDAITKIDDPKLQSSNFMKFMHKINRGQVSFEDNQVIDRSDNRPVSTSVIDDWLQEYDTGDREEDYGFNDPGEWAREYENFTGSLAPERLAEYQFVVNNAANPYATHEDPFTAGVELFNEGHITESVLALEAEVARNPMNSVAWQYLGQAHAENDKDGQAIISLEKAVQVDPQNLDALAALAVSYTNDFNREKALDVLETWLRRSGEYAHIPDQHPHPQDNEHTNFYSEPWGRHSRVAAMFLEAAQLRPHDPDPEVQTALGLLYNLSYEYDRAVDCFKAALTKRPSDYRLWNKLGATLANSNRSEEALGAYFKALEGKPTYVRARANLGISFLALNSYQEAAQSFLSALRLHPNATHLWDNLKMVFRLMGRDDLEERATNNDVEAFSDEFAY